MSTTANPKTVFVVSVVLLACLQAPHAFVGEAAFSAHGEQAVPASGSASALARNSLGMRFVEIPAGSFDMGSTIGPGEAPVHRVSVPAFWMGVTEVTQGQWQAIMGSNPSHFKQAGPNAPVEMVSWNDVQAFIAKMNAREADRRYRLPSEAEWEYACRAGSAKDPYGRPTEIGWIKENSGGTTHPVGQKRPNGFGLYDMQGNVSEWTQDTYHPDYNGAPADGRAWTTAGVQQHTLRGGGWDLPAFFIHSALRGPYDPIHRLGFRLVCVPVAQANGYSAARPSTSVVAEIPFALLRNKTIVPVAAGGASLRLILDTGMGRDGIMLFRGDGVDTAGFGRASQARLLSSFPTSSLTSAWTPIRRHSSILPRIRLLHRGPAAGGEICRTVAPSTAPGATPSVTVERTYFRVPPAVATPYTGGMDRDDVRRWREARHAVEEFERQSARRAAEPAVCWRQALSLFALLDRLVGWPVAPDGVRRREDASAALAWSRLREAWRARA